MAEKTTSERGYGWKWQKLRVFVLKRDSNVCFYCGSFADTVDHVVSKVHGGPDDPANLVAACGSCNYGKGGATRRDRVPAPVREGWYGQFGNGFGPCSRRWADDFVWVGAAEHPQTGR